MRNRARSLSVAICAVVAMCSTVPASAAPGFVWTDRGAVRGVITPKVTEFHAIPFAKPPTGELRWRAPQPAAHWPGVRDATEPPPNCFQDPVEGVPGPQSEDCLYLTVTTPRTASPHRPRPVMLWLHGGGFYSGGGRDYDARRLAAEGDVVVVVPNYRLGVFGFLDLPGLADAGSFGLLDQQAALRWTQRNVRAFGGDPRNVTLIGESAGAMSVCAQLTSPGSAGLFHRAVMQSGTCLVNWPAGTGSAGHVISPFESRQRAAATGAVEAVAQSCPDLATALSCLRAKPPGALLPRMRKFTPVYGNATLPDHPATALRANRFHRVPVMAGTNRDESRASIAVLFRQPVAAARYLQLLEEDFGPVVAGEVAQLYPPQDDDNRITYATVHTDRIWAHTSRDAQRLLAKQVPVYAYEFGDRAAPVLPSLPDAGFPLGAYHGAEVAYLFDIRGFTPSFTSGQRRLAAQMVRYWARFAWTADPNAPELPRWQRVPHVQSFAPVAIKPVDYAAEHRLGFWDRTR